MLQNLAENSENKRRLQTPTCRLEDTIKVYLKGIGYENVNCISLRHDRLHWRNVV